MPMELEPRYNPEGEDEIYKKWEKSGYFNPDNLLKDSIADPKKEAFSVVLPPPNVTGTLHIGHAFEDTIQDVIVRYNRMQGRPTVWVPGTDHAAIATQAKVEKLIDKEGKSKYDLGREEFLKRVDAFAKESHDTIVRQVRRMGASLDWSREAYTLDEKRNFAVRTAFKRMYDSGLIYRGYRVVNWDPKGQTVISDDEIVYEERKAKLYTFKYSKDFPIPISSTRPETKFGDTAVAVHPEDERYKEFVGKEYDIEFLGEPLHIKIIADASVEKDFGTGALGVTPAHSMVDWEISERHGLPLKPVIDERAKMTVGPEGVKGEKIIAAREKTAELLREAGLMQKEEDLTQNVSTAERTGGTVEPLPKLQWFVAVNKPFRIEHSRIEGIPAGSETTLKEIMRKAVAGGQIKILPEHFEKIYFHWIDNLRDWCISRQLWFGHRVPVWYCLSCGKEEIDAEVKERWYLVRHGETDWNKELKLTGKTDVSLNETGRAQAKKAAEMLRGSAIDIILTSPLMRARETAEVIAEAIGAEVVVDDRLHERDFGKAEGQHKDNVLTSTPDFFDWFSKDHESESYEEMEARIWPVIEDFAAKHKGKNIAFVGHGGTGRVFLKKLKNLPIEEFRNMQPIKNAAPIIFDILKPCSSCGHRFFEQDSDTLDTWFSSGLWSFSTLGWPQNTEDLKRFHPNSFMNPGYEILFFWVARMILMSGFLLGEIPFKTVCLHGMVRDKDGRKFSKSLGNGVDPLELANTYGADALRMALIVGAAPGSDVKFSEDRVRGYRNFSTKIWNAARFVLINKKAEFDTMTPKLSEEDEKNLAELKELQDSTAKLIESYQFHLAAEDLYHYFWHTFADKIIESSKTRLQSENREDAAAAWKTMEKILLTSLILMHPFIPFVTEALWQNLKPGELLMVKNWNAL